MFDGQTNHIVRDPDFGTRIRDSFSRQGFMDLMGAEITLLEPGLCEVAVDYRPELSQQKGLFHGGAMGTLADTACGYAAYSLMAAADSLLTVEYKMNITAPGDGDRLTAIGRVIKSGRQLTICDGRLFVEKAGLKKECGLVTATMMRLPDTSDRAAD